MLTGPVVRLGVALSASAFAFLVLAIALQGDHWLIYAGLFLVLLIVCAFITLRSVVFIRDDGVKIPFGPLYSWESIDGVRLAYAADMGMVCPTLETIKGRRIETVILEGLAAKGLTERLREQGELLARHAGVELECAPDPATVVPRRGSKS